MESGIVGLGKMDRNMTRRLARNGHHVVVYSRMTEKAAALAQEEPNVAVVEAMEGLAEELLAIIDERKGQSRSGE
jgi:3-hydroxyisobutyrate dehydrogenase-like beta-hydroxyacid dehydrogenase